jgi:hypothetical protein
MRQLAWLALFAVACLLAVSANGSGEWIGFGGAALLWLSRPWRRS